MSRGEDIPLGDSQKTKEPNKIKEGGGVKLGDTFSPTDFQGTTKRRKDYKTTTLLPWNHWGPVYVLFDLHSLD